MPFDPETVSKLYWALGVMILTNLGTIGSIVMFGFKGVWWASRVDSRLSSLEKHQDRHNEEIDDIRQSILN